MILSYWSSRIERKFLPDPIPLLCSLSQAAAVVAARLAEETIISDAIRRGINPEVVPTTEAGTADATIIVGTSGIPCVISGEMAMATVVSVTLANSAIVCQKIARSEIKTRAIEDSATAANPMVPKG